MRRYNAKTYSFPVLLNEGEKLFSVKGIYSSKETYVTVNKKQNKKKKICNKLSMKVSFLVEFNKEKYNLTTNLIFTKVKKYDINFYKYPSKSTPRYSQDSK